MRRILSLILVIVLCGCSCMLTSCGKLNYDTSLTGKGVDVDMEKVAAEINSKSIEDFERTENISDYVVFDVHNYGKIVVVVRMDIAPETVKNFRNLVKSGHYDNLIFHRVMKTFMIQGGGYDLTNRLHSTAPITGEFSENEFENNLLHIPGVISLARAEDYDSGSAQFFIMTEKSHWLDGSYAAFGYVLAGMDVVYAIASCEVDNPTSKAPRPVTPVLIKEAYFAKYVG